MGNRKFVVIGAGQSLKDEDLEKIRIARFDGRIHGVIITNRVYEKAGWADILCAFDKQFWDNYPDAKRFSGGKFTPKSVNNTIRYIPYGMQSGTNSGLYACHLAKDLGADLIILIGFDMHGTHFHGNHDHGLKNPSENDFQRYIRQFEKFNFNAIVNATKESALKLYPFIELDDALNGKISRTNIY